MSVTVQTAELRSSPSFFGRIVATLEYGDMVRVQDEQGSWFEVISTETRENGWIHVSALERRRIIFAASDQDVPTEATSGEIALAGKGFNKEVEERYSATTELDFSRVDQLERALVPFDTIARFARDGGLTTLDEADS